MAYKYYSQTSSGWLIETDPNADPDRRWRATHQQFGERFFDEHDKILEYTVRRMVEQLKQLMSDPVMRADLMRKMKKS